MSREKELVKNTIILSLGSFLPQLTSLITLPLLTAYLTKTEYGTYDLINTIISLIIPIITIRIESAAFRFMIEYRNDTEKSRQIVSTILIFGIYSSVMVFFLTAAIFSSVPLTDRILIMLSEKKRLFSVIIAVYNVEKYLEECLVSVLSQHYENWECILIDDGSTDANSAVICDKYAKQDSRFKVIHRKNEGSLMARRYGLTQAQGDYLLFIDSDDYMHKELLQYVDKIITETQSDLVIYRFQWVNKVSATDSEIIFPEGTIIGNDGKSKKILWEKLPTCNSLNNLWLKVFKKQCVDMDTDYSRYAYLQFGTDLMQSLPILDRAQKIYFTEKIFYYYRYNDSGITSKKAERNDMESIDKYFHTKNTIMQETLRYMKNCGYNTDKMIRLQYASYFKGCMEVMVSWLYNERSRRGRERIVNRVLQDTSLLACKNYMLGSELTGIYGRLYGAFANDNLKKMKNVLSILVLYKKAAIMKRDVMESLVSVKSKRR